MDRAMRSARSGSAGVSSRVMPDLEAAAAGAHHRDHIGGLGHLDPHRELRRDAVGDVVHRLGDRRQAMDARPALTGGLTGQPFDDPGALVQPAGGLADRHDHPGPERGPARQTLPGVAVGEGGAVGPDQEDLLARVDRRRRRRRRCSGVGHPEQDVVGVPEEAG